MSTPETRHIEDIVDKEGVPIVNNIDWDMSMIKHSSEQQHAAQLETSALRAGGNAKLEEAQAIEVPEGPSREFADAYQQRSNILKDASILLDSSQKAEQRAFEAGQSVKKTTETSAQYANEYLQEHIELAANLANQDLARRLRNKAITSDSQGMVGFRNIELVDPATSNEDVTGPANPGPQQ